MAEYRTCSSLPLALRCFFVLFLLLPVLSSPLPLQHRAPTRQQKHLHRKEDSPIYCSRAVSRWVRAAWDAIVPEAVKGSGEVLSPGTINQLLSPTCPFRDPPGDSYFYHEQSKEPVAYDGTHSCGICHKTFKTEYHLDRHLDRRHSFPDLLLLDSYRGGIVAKVFDLRTNTTILIEPTSTRLRPWGPCLEHYCPIFDVCDRPYNRRYPVIDNNLSITFPSHTQTPAVLSEQLYDGPCSAHLLSISYAQCQNLINRCFPVQSSRPSVRHANIYLHRNLCGALEECSRYMTRRLYSGSASKYLEAAYLGKINLPISALPGYKIVFIILTGIGLILAASASLCCCLEIHETRDTRKRSASDVRPFAYRSAMELVSQMGVAARRRQPEITLSGDEEEKKRRDLGHVFQPRPQQQY